MNYNVSGIIGEEEKIDEVIEKYDLYKWHKDSIGNMFIIMLDDEDDPFILYITDSDLYGFNILSSNTYLSLTTEILNRINYTVEDFCDTFDWDSI